jgi:hypothetical protein
MLSKKIVFDDVQEAWYKKSSDVLQVTGWNLDSSSYSHTMSHLKVHIFREVILLPLKFWCV